MQDKRTTLLQPVLFNSGLWLCAITLLLLARDAVERVTGPVEESWLDLDLALVLIAYVLLFLLEP
ncbi:MAG: hypothetical protein WBB95_28560, partial [Pseudomonas sp.]|uniref:hypothetical protein n=1 Tax=Pseudomonas sp. TaxID=306 RepID=UPI003C74BDDA